MTALSAYVGGNRWIFEKKEIASIVRYSINHEEMVLGCSWLPSPWSWILKDWGQNLHVNPFSERLVSMQVWRETIAGVCTVGTIFRSPVGDYYWSLSRQRSPELGLLRVTLYWWELENTKNYYGVSPLTGRIRSRYLLLDLHCQSQVLIRHLKKTTCF